MSDQTTADRLARANRLARRLRHEAQGSQYPFHGLLTEAAEKIDELTALLAEAERPTFTPPVERREPPTEVNFDDESYDPAERPTPPPDAEDARATVASIAAMLGWENVPPRRTLEMDIAALKARAQSPPDAVTRAKLETAQAAIIERDGSLWRLSVWFNTEEAASACLRKGTPHAD